MQGTIERMALADEGLRQEALALVWAVFCEFEAPEYGEEGVSQFADFIRPEAVRAMMAEQGMEMWVWREEGTVRGVLASRPPCHVSLLFVGKTYHRRGIARQLFETMCGFYRGRGLSPEQPVTVNSSPYAVQVYRRLGFAQSGPERTEDGIRFTPMCRPLGGIP